jgi:ABC-type nickel/cobalt efflux system permease component RcnA
MDLALAAANDAFRIGLVATAFGFGFRHGIDWDHIAALTDITTSQESRRQSMIFATLYALGHALVVFILGSAAVVLAERLPTGVDSVMERFVGVTLIVLGFYVFYSLLRHGRDFRMRSRWMLLIAGIRRLWRWTRDRRSLVVIAHEHDHPVHEPHPADERAPVPTAVGTSSAVHTVRHRHKHRHVVPLPDDPFMRYGRGTAFAVGMIHGVGAETPTQVLIFLAAAGAGGKGAGVLLLACFIAGLVMSNSLIALAATFGFGGAARKFWLYATISVVTATFSLVVGTMFIFGKSTLLPALFGG